MHIEETWTEFLLQISEFELKARMLVTFSQNELKLIRRMKELVQDSYSNLSKGIDTEIIQEKIAQGRILKNAIKNDKI